jgi:hypothetical protein
MSITSDSTLQGTCCVCGKPISPLIGALPPLPGLKTAKCSKCGKHACAEHIKAHSKNCEKGGATGNDWCGTAGIKDLLP